MAARARRIAYIDPVDLRFNRFEPSPKPSARAVMFCLMDVSGSMTEDMKDLAKRFFLLLHMFLSRKYEHVDVVFIRHTSEAREVDEETFFRSQETGGTVVSTALAEMRRIVEARYPIEEWNIYAAQASDGDNYSADSETCTRLLQDEILPICQYFAYVEVYDRRQAEIFLSNLNVSELWKDYQSVAAGYPNFAMKRVFSKADVFPVFHQLFAKIAQGRLKGQEGGFGMSAPLFDSGEWAFDTLKHAYDAIEQIAIGEMGLDPYPNQIELISSEQMLDAYSSIGMPIFYHHWSFGKRFARDEKMYRKGYTGLAYEIVINSNPCISYIMEENTMTMQALVMAHAAFGHNHFFKNNYLFKDQTDADGILDYLNFAKTYVSRCEERHGISAVERILDAAHALMDQGVNRYGRRARPSLAEERARAEARHAHVQETYSDLWRTLPVRRPPPSAAPAPSPPSRGRPRWDCPRRTCSISSRNSRPGSRTGSANCCASCATSPSISTRSG